jgi:hypothetical protein
MHVPNNFCKHDRTFLSLLLYKIQREVSEEVKNAKRREFLISNHFRSFSIPRKLTEVR